MTAASEPKIISILMPVYDVYAWIGEAIKSTLSQDLPDGWDLELLVAIDGCPAALEEVRRVLDETPDRRMGVVVLAKNVGWTVAANTLLGFARGELIARFDADDVMFPGRLRKLMRRLEEEKLEAVYSAYTEMRGKARKVSAAGGQGPCLFRKAVFDRLGGWQPWRCGADSEFLSRIRYAGMRWRKLPESTFLRRVHPRQLTRAPATRHGSRLRNQICERIREAEKGYARGVRPPRVEPETGPVSGLEGPLFAGRR